MSDNERRADEQLGCLTGPITVSCITSLPRGHYSTSKYMGWYRTNDGTAPLRHRQCHLPLAPRAQVELADEEQLDYRHQQGNDGNGQHRSRLMEDGEPRPSEEETAWRRG